MNTYVLKEVDSVAIVTINNPFVGVKCNIDLSDMEDLLKAARDLYEIISKPCKTAHQDGGPYITFKADISEPLSRLKKGIFKSNCDCKIYVHEDSDIIGITFSDNMYSESQEHVEKWINDKIIVDLHEAISDITIFRTDM